MSRVRRELVCTQYRAELVRGDPALERRISLTLCAVMSLLSVAFYELGGAFPAIEAGFIAAVLYGTSVAADRERLPLARLASRRRR